MKLGVSYNVFSGADLLKPAILNAKPFSDYIVCVYSDVSNTGEPAPKYLRPLLEDLKNENLINEIILHKPIITQSLGQMQGNNRAKRMLGKEACFKQGCTHYMSRDCDEFYNIEQFKNVKEKLGNFDFTVAHIYEYALSPTNMNPVISGLSVPVIHKIHFTYKFARNVPVLVDKERTVDNATNIYVCKPEELVMHHMCGVRYNEDEYKRKQHGHPHFIRIKINPNTYYEDLKKQTIYNKIVEDQFGILEYWEKEFKKYV